MLGHQLLEVKEELKQTKKRKDRYAEMARARWLALMPSGGWMLSGTSTAATVRNIASDGVGECAALLPPPVPSPPPLLWPARLAHSVPSRCQSSANLSSLPTSAKPRTRSREGRAP